MDINNSDTSSRSNDGTDDNNRSTTITTTITTTTTPSSSSLFTIIHKRLQQLEKWYELAIRPSSIDQCHPEDRDLFRMEQDDCKKLAQRCLEVRTEMNDNLPVHETQWESSLRPRVSRIPNAGKGLFYDDFTSIIGIEATDDRGGGGDSGSQEIIPKGSTICYYYGHIHNFQSLKQIKDKSYLMLVSGDVHVDPRPCFHIKARYINDPLNFRFYNCSYQPDPDHFRSKVVALRDIKSGEELFASYGEAYWTNQPVEGAFYNGKPNPQSLPSSLSE
mmetsp:Transcript_3543/g.5187  ORF Transcript_3543/g.5187 Transcript_3543/m.5187 type:complete len:275 (-) Transcript_3543:279-1103(-)|eukprot:CAMPEP_0202467018 /NCGR_PEP_ID=MMETSP1360-20130828/70653_1 /ASSEMBLY_ACC=CAM_ASM_000848 /TAXON_ID=515479 /ORGANISM="Licmophora paradoxa, Strain CCMP2313" /LENGTH=274 /DNA_ID=CAMNT_0049091363 /DNA_START=145 /DNA_END=969 /DNA_ORIENTATION=-